MTSAIPSSAAEVDEFDGGGGGGGVAWPGESGQIHHLQSMWIYKQTYQEKTVCI